MDMNATLSWLAALPRIAIAIAIAIPLMLLAPAIHAQTPGDASRFDAIEDDFAGDTANDQPADAAPRVYALDRGQGITVADDPRTLLEQAEEVPPKQAAGLLLRAIEGFILLGQLGGAQDAVARLTEKPMTTEQRHLLLLYHAQIASGRGEYAAAVAVLDDLDKAALIARDTETRGLALRADLLLALGRNAEAVEALTRYDLKVEPNARWETQQRIIQLIGAMSAREKQRLRNLTKATAGWTTLAAVLDIGDSESQMRAMQQWRAKWRKHPAEPRLLNAHLPARRLNQYRHIAVLLPLSSSIGKPAQAFYEGFIAARNSDAADLQPQVSLYDIGDDPALVSLYLQAAIKDGADFVVGPLGREAIDALFESRQLRLPTLLIGSVPPIHAGSDRFGISLSPEQDARQAALRAFADGHQKAAIFRGQSKWGERVADAFVEAWNALGGVVVDDLQIPENIADYQEVIREFLALDSSTQRQQTLSNALSIDLEFTPRRRHDIDFLFLAANATQARKLVPQLRFYQAHNLALYATSYVYGGMPNAGVDADLDGVIFGDMHWIIDGASGPKPAAVKHDGLTLSAQREASPYYHGEFERLYALGMDSYPLIPRLVELRKNERRFFGRAMDIGVDEDGNAWRYPTWAQFERGLPRALNLRETAGSADGQSRVNSNDTQTVNR